MNTWHNRWIYAGFLLLLLAACREFIEPSIEDSKVVLVAPGDNHGSSNYTQTFWWEPVKDALSYRLQIVSPRFDSIGSLVLDTLVKSDKFTFTLAPGKYEWRVRAENGSSQSLYATRKLTIHQSSIKDQQVQLNAPAHNLLTNQVNITYKWNSLFGATRYRLQIDTNNFSNEALLVFDNTTPGLEYSVPFTADQRYQWRVRAENDTAQSKWSAIYAVTYDTRPPAQVSLSSPAQGQIAAKPVNLQWSAAATAAKYQLYVYKSDSATLYNSTFPLTLTNTSYSFNNGITNEKVYWKVRAVDQAGNEGAFSSLRNFIVQ